MTTRQLTALGRRFMRLLEMDEWIARAEFKSCRTIKDADLGELDGRSFWHPEERKCWIEVAQADPGVMGETLLHEILHLLYEGHMSPMGVDGYDAGYELGLNRTAKALYREWSKGDC